MPPTTPQRLSPAALPETATKSSEGLPDGGALGPTRRAMIEVLRSASKDSETSVTPDVGAVVVNRSAGQAVVQPKASWLQPPSRAMAAPLPGRAAMHWALDPSLTFLNHGSYGAVPKRVLRAQAEYRERMERDPVRLFKHDLEHLVDASRERVAAFVNANPGDVAMVRNATHALCTILRATPFRSGDEVLVTDHEYGSLFNELERMSQQIGIKVVKAQIPFPVSGPQVVLDRVMGAITPRTRLVCISHVTSTSALVLPVAAIIRECNARGVDVILDGAHSPGQIPVDVRALNPTYFIGSGHKWLSGPKGSAFVVVRPDKQPLFRPLALSARANKVRPERALFLRDYDYQGTDDYSPIATLPAAIDAMGELLPGGWPQLMRENHELVLQARKILCDALGLEPSAPDTMVGSMVTLKIPEPPAHLKARPTCYDDALQDILFEKYRIVVPIWRLMCSDERIVRISAQLYNTPEQYQFLARALQTELAAEWR